MTLPRRNWARSTLDTILLDHFPAGEISKEELLKETVVFLAEQYVFAPAQAACLEIVCLVVAPTNCLEPRNVF